MEIIIIIFFLKGKKIKKIKNKFAFTNIYGFIIENVYETWWN